MRTYSLDLRLKIIETYYSEAISQWALAKRFKVALSFVTKLLKQWRETGTLDRAPLPSRPRNMGACQFCKISILCYDGVLILPTSHL